MIDEKQETKKSIIGMYGRTVSYKLICVVIGFVNSILINRCLGVALRGDYTTIINWASLLQLVLNLGIGTAYPAFKRKYKDVAKTIFTTIGIIISSIYLVLLIVLVPFFSHEIRYICLIAYLTTVENFLIFIAIVENVSKRNLINIITSCVHTGILGLIFLLLRFNLEAILGAVMLDHVVLCVAFIWFYKITSFKPKLINKKLLREIFAIAIPAMLMNMLMYLNYHADVLFLSGITHDSIEVGLYGTAVTLGNMLWIVPDAFKDIMYNRAAKKDNPKEVVIAILCNMGICIMVLIGFVFLGKWFLNTMYGSDFVASYPLVLTLFIGTLPMVLYKLIHPIYIANGKTKTVVILLTIAVFINIIGDVVLIPEFKGMGAAVSSVISYMICGVIFFVKFKVDYSVSLKEMLRKK